MRASLILVFCMIISSCKDSKKEDSLTSQQNSTSVIAKIIEENFNIKEDTLVFNSGTIENFDKDARSIDVYWIGEERDTVLRFYRKYDKNNILIGAEYYEEDDTEPSRDTVYINQDGLKVEASLNAENQITWTSTITTDNNGNPVLKTYQNGKGEYRGLDSLFFDDENRVIKGFYKNSKGKRYSIRTYEYLKSDNYGNWTERKLFKNDTLSQKQIRILSYHE